MTNRTNYLTVGLVIAVLIILGGYVVMYYAMLDGATYDHKISGSNSFRADPVYRAEGEFIPTLLLPAHMLDRIIRPSRWLPRWPPLAPPPIVPAA